MRENQMVATDAKRMNNSEINNRSAWNNGVNVIGKNYRAKNDFENAPIGAVAIFPAYSTELVSGDKVEQWKKIGKDEWEEIDAKTYCKLYEQYNGGKQTYELEDNGQFTYGYQYLVDSRLREEIADKIKDHLFWGEDCEDDFVVYECDNGDYTFAYTFNWLDNELTYQITNEDGYCESFTDGDNGWCMYDRVDAMMEWLEEHLLEIDRREWEKNNKNN